MKPPLGSLHEQIYSVSRAVIGCLFGMHGAQKLFAVLGREEAVEVASRLGVAGLIELVGGALVALGLFTPWVALIASGEMAFAYFLAHQPRGPWPLVNGGEAAVLYCFIFLYFATRGSGPWSLDHAIGGRRRPHSAAPSS